MINTFHFRQMGMELNHFDFDGCGELDMCGPKNVHFLIPPSNKTSQKNLCKIRFKMYIYTLERSANLKCRN